MRIKIYLKRAVLLKACRKSIQHLIINALQRGKKKSAGPRWYKQSFREQWKSKHIWAEKRNKSTFCTACQSTVIGGLAHLDRHADKKKHISNMKKIQGAPINEVIASKPNSTFVERKVAMFFCRSQFTFQFGWLLSAAYKNMRQIQKCSRASDV